MDQTIDHKAGQATGQAMDQAMGQAMPVARSADLKALIQAIDKLEFKALSPGLGLGQVRPAGLHKSRPLSGPPSQGLATPATQPSAVAMTSGQPAPAVSTHRPSSPLLQAARSRAAGGVGGQAAQPLREAGLGRLVLAWSLDLLFVALALFGSLALAFAAHAWRGDSASWLAGRPVQWLLSLNPMISLAAVYALFLVYALFFRMLVGRTCGETLLGLRPTPLRRTVRG